MPISHGEERDLAVDRMATSIAKYLERRYDDNSLITLSRHLKGDEQLLARALASGERFIGSSIAPKPVQPQPSSGYCPIRRKRKVKKVNKKRRVSEWARAYGSKARVEWIKAQPCIYCVAVLPYVLLIDKEWHNHNAHTVTGGKGRKADCTMIVPLCSTHHSRYDQHQFPFDTDDTRAWIRGMADEVDKAWQAHSQRGE